MHKCILLKTIRPMTKININIALQNLQYLIPGASYLHLGRGFKPLQIPCQLLRLPITAGCYHEPFRLDLRTLELVGDYGVGGEVGLVAIEDGGEGAVRIVDERVVGEFGVE